MSIKSYLRNVKGEWKHIVWPTRAQTIWFTVTVIILSLVVAYYLGLLDILFAKLLTIIL